MQISAFADERDDLESPPRVGERTDDLVTIVHDDARDHRSGSRQTVRAAVGGGLTVETCSSSCGFTGGVGSPVDNHCAARPIVANVRGFDLAAKEQVELP